MRQLIGAAVQLVVGRTSSHKWTRGGKERGVCDVCGWRIAMRGDGHVRKHQCVAKPDRALE